VGSFAWLPNSFAPHVSAGVGLMWYSFRQQGDFVDVDDEDIFSATLSSNGWAPSLQLGAGVDFTLSPGLVLAADARYTHARATMSEDFSGFDKIDLSGVQATVGLKFRF
jgi:opacity protein-like surface antigen